MITSEHSVQMLTHITEQDWTSQNEINRDHISPTAAVTTIFLNREKPLSI